MKYEDLPDGPPTASWFSASHIHLRSDRSGDFIVVARPPLIGANVTTFWVVVHDANGWHIALTVHAHELVVLRKRFNRYRMIEASGATCCKITTARFRYYNSTYKRFYSKTEPIR